jgi:hypothetical protein
VTASRACCGLCAAGSSGLCRCSILAFCKCMLRCMCWEACPSRVCPYPDSMMSRHSRLQCFLDGSQHASSHCNVVVVSPGALRDTLLESWLLLCVLQCRLSIPCTATGPIV